MFHLWLIWILLADVCSEHSLRHALHCGRKDRAANSFLWSIHRSPPAYLFGTIHVPYDKVWRWIPHNTKEAFSNSDSAIFELDLTNPFTMSSLAECQMLPAGDVLTDVLPADLYSRLQRHFDFIQSTMPGWMSQDQIKKGITSDYVFSTIAGNWRRKRPVWIMLLVNSLTEAEVKSRGTPVLDLYLAQRAEKEGIMTGAVEKVEEQCLPFNQVNVSQVIFALNATLSRHEELRVRLGGPAWGSDTLALHYNCGNLDALMFSRDSTQVPSLMTSPLPAPDIEKAKLIEEYFQHELIDKRNARMAQRVSYLLEQYPHTSFFFAFGAGHFLGQETVIDRLHQAGYNITHTKPHEVISRSKSGLSGKSRKAIYQNFPLASDVIHGDFKYLLDIRFKKYLKFRKERRKFIRSKKRQQRLDQIWEQLVINSQNLKKISSAEKTGKNFTEHTFNDLWIPVEQISAQYLQQMSDRQMTQVPQNISSGWTKGHLSLLQFVTLLHIIQLLYSCLNIVCNTLL